MKSLLFAASLLAPGLLATPLRHSARGVGSGQNVVYWGQNDDQRSLKEYCEPKEGIDVIILTFLSQLKDGKVYGQLGADCVIQPDGSGKCDQLKSDIDYCKSQKKTVLVSLGGADGKYSFSGPEDADTAAMALWNSWAAPKSVDSNAPRPIGDSFVDGWDFNIEGSIQKNGPMITQMVNTLRKQFGKDPSNKYLISGAPQCPIPEPYIGDTISKAKFDMLFIQFYNNEGCSAYQATNPNVPGGMPGGKFNFDDWATFTGNSSSAGAKLYIGLLSYKATPEPRLPLVMKPEPAIGRRQSTGATDPNGTASSSTTTSNGDVTPSLPDNSGPNDDGEISPEKATAPKDDGTMPSDDGTITPDNPLGPTEITPKDDGGAHYFIPPAQLPILTNKYASHVRFGGIMMWDAAHSDKTVENGCTYAQQVRKVLDTGKPC